MKSIKFSEAISIEEKAETVFDFTQDYQKRLAWDTFLKQADLIEGATAAGKGVKTYCVAQNGVGITSEYVTYNRPKVTAVKMTKGPYMFKTFLGSWNFKEESPTHTQVTFLYSFTLRFPFSLFKNYIRNTLQKNVRQRLRDLKRNVESSGG